MNANPVMMKRGFDLGRAKIIEFLEEIKQPI